MEQSTAETLFKEWTTAVEKVGHITTLGDINTTKFSGSTIPNHSYLHLRVLHQIHSQFDFEQLLKDADRLDLVSRKSDEKRFRKHLTIKDRTPQSLKTSASQTVPPATYPPQTPPLQPEAKPQPLLLKPAQKNYSSM